MRFGLLLLALTLVLGSAALASADSIGGPCPSGQIYQANPTAPGAMHHGGGQCVPDPNARACSVGHGHAAAPVLFPTIALVLLAGRKKRRDKVTGA
jgi:hypothetical protein